MLDKSVMSCERNRFWRRAQRRRIKRRALDIARATGRPIRWTIKNADNIKSCSCWMCGNPRRYFGEQTLQERLFIEGAREQELELQGNDGSVVLQRHVDG